MNFKTASTVLPDLQKAVDDIDTVDDKGNDRETVEDSLSGIHQAIVCGNRLGWRPNSKKIIVTFTDSMFHLNWEKAKVGQILGIPSYRLLTLNSKGLFNKCIHFIISTRALVTKTLIRSDVI